MSAKAKRVGHLTSVPQGWTGEPERLFSPVTAEGFAKEMRGLLRQAAEAINDCRQEEQEAWEAAEESTLDVIEGPAETARKRLALRRVNKFAAASKFVELTALILHKTLGEPHYSSETVGSGLAEEQRLDLSIMNSIGRQAARRDRR